MASKESDVEQIDRLVQDFIQRYRPGEMTAREVLGALFDAGLAWIHFPVGHGGLGLDIRLQASLEQKLQAAGVPRFSRERNPLGLGTVAPTLVQFGTESEKSRYLRPLWTGEEIWCQLFSESGAGSDLADLGTRAERDGSDSWVINGHKLWTSYGPKAAWGFLLARSDPDRPKHRGITCFICDMKAPGVSIMPMRELTGEQVFSEVRLEDVRIPDSARLGEVNDGWRVTRAALQNERMSAGDTAVEREMDAIGQFVDLWKTRRQQEPGLDAIVASLVAENLTVRATESLVRRSRKKDPSAPPGPEAAAIKLLHAQHQQRLTRAWLELVGDEGLRYDGWDSAPAGERCAGYYFLRSKYSSIGGGTSEIMRNILAEDVLGLPREARTDVTIPWKDVPR